LSLGLDQYLSAVKRFNESVSDLVAQLDQINKARVEALKASEELRAELDTTDKQIQETAASVIQHIASLELPKKTPHSDEILRASPARRAG
jgi:peptidoglycan hydrolase CwlO-like protein